MFTFAKFIMEIQKMICLISTAPINGTEWAELYSKLCKI